MNNSEISVSTSDKGAAFTGVICGIIGAAGMVALVSSAGTITGFNEAGIISGLNAVGGFVGGSIDDGFVVSTIAPVLIGTAFYSLYKWLKN